jgi:hypothetical protein
LHSPYSKTVSEKLASPSFSYSSISESMTDRVL